MAVFSAIAAFAAASFIGGLIVNTAISVGLSALAQALSGKQGPKDQGFGVKGQLDRGADVPQSFIMGRYATAGTLTYANSVGLGAHEPNAYLHYAVTLSDLPIGGVSGLWVNGAKVTMQPTGNNEYVIPQYNSSVGPKLVVAIFDGNQTWPSNWLQTASSPERPWDGSAIGRGKAYAVIRAHVDDDLWGGTFPNFLFEVEGIPLYDISQDSSVGGVGSQRWSDRSTWTWNDNPAVQLYNILRGISYSGEWFYGLQDVTEAQLPAAHWIYQIQKTREWIDGASGPEQHFRSSGEVPVSAPIHTVIESLLDACNGRLSDAGGVYKLFAGAPDAPVMTFTDDDIISTKEQTFTPFLGLSDTVNGVTAKYPEPDAAWQVETAPPLYRPDYEDEDGGRRLLVDVNLDFVPHAEQAQRLMKAALNEARRARRHTLTLPPEFWQLEPGDTVAWTSDRNGYAAKQFRVDGIIDGPDADVVLDLTEVDPADYTFDTDVDFTPPAIPSVDPQPIDPQQVTDFMVLPHVLSDAGGIDRRPAIMATWDGDVVGVRTTKFQIRVKDTGELIPSAQTNDVADGLFIIENGILPNTEYEVRAQHVPNGPRPSVWTTWRSVTTPDIRYGYGDLDQKIQDDINNIAANAGIPTVTVLPAAGEKPNQIILKMPEAVLYRWDDTASEWSPQLYTDIQDDQITSDMIAAGAILATKIGAGEITTPLLAAGAVDVSKMIIDNQLVISAQKGAFVMGKDSAYNVSDDGVYMGRTEEPGGVTGFGFAASKTASNGRVQSLSATYDNGLRITNANFYRNFNVTPDPAHYTTNQTINLLPGTLSISLAIMAGGGGGASGGAQSNQLVNDGGPGGDTVVTLRDGSVVKAVWTAPGGGGGIGSVGYYNGSYGAAGQGTAWGTGGAASPGSGYPGTGYGASGGGGGGVVFGPSAGQRFWGGNSGSAGSFVQVLNYDVTGLSNPNLVISIGAGGVPGDAIANRGYIGGYGAQGRIAVTQLVDAPTVSDVIPTTPQNWGKLPSGTTFPNLGAGFWSITSALLGGAQINIGSGRAHVVGAQRGASFISSATPFVADGNLGANVSYLFYKMGP